MVIKINEIQAEGLTLELKDRIDLFDTGAATTAFTASIAVEPAGEGLFHIKGRVKAAPELECSRCLRKFPFPIDAEMDFDLAPLGSIGAEHEYELGKGELEMEFYKGEDIEPVDFVKEHLLVSVPMVPLHDPDCRGLCPVCGADLNEKECGCRRDVMPEGGAFAALKDLFKNRKE